MGTWGPGPYANDTADELLDTLTATPPAARAAALADVLHAALADDADPAEAVAAAALVVAGLEATDALVDGAVARDLVPAARRALDACVPDDGWYWQTWTDPDDLAAARRVVTRLRGALDDAGAAVTGPDDGGPSGT